MTKLDVLKLRIDVGDAIDCNLVEAISYQIASGPLQSLEIFSCEIANEKKTRKKILLPLLDALAGVGNASKLQEFKLQLIATSIGRVHAKTYAARMIEILQRNTTLTNVKIRLAWHYGHMCEKTEKDEIIVYHTTLNRFGRHLLRGTEKSLDMAQLVTSVISQAGTPKGVRVQQLVPLLYGLLREAPHKWSSPQAGKCNKAKLKRPALKRKASSSLDRSSSKH
ncbi:expressed unknown protein [Seminavis robusta]|uniref:Uncharacterized protein n=1 Tax=Seminavis robusta TaxID=568900 RepID=A0A9N8H9X9_9STRA|nr:hypothetical protein SEMRO_221_G091030.1 [Seminavis robusta]CAB9505185.1 expressed unknown protein [Seminavis robusta]CAB9505186.1 expressed unknown protein [Seminavis robusta]|eukprot:Sro221_g091030.1 n/a (223) ;mRNA; r:56682-57350